MSKTSVWKDERGILVCGVGLLLVGCGGSDNVGRVTGKVTLDGKPLTGALVQFEPIAGNSPSAGFTDASGQYMLKYAREIEGAEIGEHKVRITTYSAGDADADPPKPAVRERLPVKYHDKTELKATVKAGSNTWDFPLESAGQIVQPKPDE